MIKDNIMANENIKPNSNEIKKLKMNFPQLFNKDGEFFLDRFKEMLKQNDIIFTKEGYELKFLGKSYARYLSSTKTETFIVPNIEENEKEENKNSENLYIIGDNLDALKHLLGSYSSKIKCIYIDPPYNTGSDGFVYPDNFSFDVKKLADIVGIEEEEAERIINLKGKSSHSAWLTFMYPRLILARELLSDDGAVFISIDDNEQANLKLICDEIFGEENFVEEIIWEKKSSAKGVPPKNMIVNVHEYLLVYQKTENFKFIGEERSKDGFKNPDNDPRGLWRESNIKSTTKRKDEAFTIVDPNTGKEYTNTWAFSKSSLEKMIKENRIIWKNNLPKQKEFFYEMTNEKKAIKSNWGVYDPQSTTVFLKEILPDIHFDNPKPISFMEYLLSISTQENDIVLDLFSGSATTAHALLNLNSYEKNGKRKFILIQIPEPIKNSKISVDAGFESIDKIGIERIKLSAKKIKETTAACIDYGFKIFSLETLKEVTLTALDSFDSNPKLLLNDTVRIFDTEKAKGKDTILSTYLALDGYGLSINTEKYKLKNFVADKINTSLYIIEKGLRSQDIMELIRQIESLEIDITRIVVYADSLQFNILHELKKNLSNLKNNKTVELIVRY